MSCFIIFPRPISSFPISSHLISPHLTSSHLTSSHLTSSHLTSSHLISSHLISSHRIASHHITCVHEHTHTHAEIFSRSLAFPPLFSSLLILPLLLSLSSQQMRKQRKKRKTRILILSGLKVRGVWEGADMRTGEQRGMGQPPLDFPSPLSTLLPTRCLSQHHVV